jgi:hypothetical protein
MLALVVMVVVGVTGPSVMVVMRLDEGLRNAQTEHEVTMRPQVGVAVDVPAVAMKRARAHGHRTARAIDERAAALEHGDADVAERGRE